MGVLNDWQKPSRVCPSDVGTGKDGDINYSGGDLGGLPGVGYAIFSANAEATNFNITDRYYFNGGNGGRVGDIVLLHQTWGNGAGQWEINKIVARSGSNITLAKPLKYSYSNGQIISSGQYRNFTVNGNITARAWDGVGFGIIFLVVKEVLSGTAQISVYGKGFRGGNNYVDGTASAEQGEGTGGPRTRSTAPNGNGGGGADVGVNGGAGGSHATRGEPGEHGSSQPGNIVGTSDLTSLNFGGGGGGAHSRSQPGTIYNDPGNGGGIVVIFAREYNFSGGIIADGHSSRGYAIDNINRAGNQASGAGGSVLIVGDKINLGNNIITAKGGARNDYNRYPEDYYGGAGGLGRIAVHYRTSVTGVTTPSATLIQNNLIMPAEGGAFLYNLL